MPIDFPMPATTPCFPQLSISHWGGTFITIDEHEPWHLITLSARPSFTTAQHALLLTSFKPLLKCFLLWPLDIKLQHLTSFLSGPLASQFLSMTLFQVEHLYRMLHLWMPSVVCKLIDGKCPLPSLSSSYSRCPGNICWLRGLPWWSRGGDFDFQCRGFGPTCPLAKKPKYKTEAIW